MLCPPHIARRNNGQGASTALDLTELNISTANCRSMPSRLRSQHAAVAPFPNTTPVRPQFAFSLASHLRPPQGESDPPCLTLENSIDLGLWLSVQAASLVLRHLPLSPL